MSGNEVVAYQWLLQDISVSRSDKERLGVRGAAEWHYEWAKSEVEKGDFRWEGISIEQLENALKNI